jgi:hypothetical protein
MATTLELPQVAAERRRHAERFRCVGACRVRVLGGWDREASGLTLDISEGGIGFILLLLLPEGTKVLVERKDAGTVLATVVRAERLVNGWLHGSQLAAPLTEQELAVWLR